MVVEEEAIDAFCTVCIRAMALLTRIDTFLALFRAITETVKIMAKVTGTGLVVIIKLQCGCVI